MLYLYHITNKGLVYAGPGCISKRAVYAAQGYLVSEFKLIIE